jgi:hypothetical protein
MTAGKGGCDGGLHTLNQCPQTEVMMRTRVTSRASRIIRWLRETWDEMDYAQRRLIELRLGVPSLRVPSVRSEVDELEAVYALPSRDRECDRE